MISRLPLLLSFCIACPAQQPNSAFAALNLDATASGSVPLPIHIDTLTDSSFAVHVRGFPGPHPYMLLASAAGSVAGVLSPGLISGFGFDIDIADTGAPGLGDQILINGFDMPDTVSVTDAAGRQDVAGLLPSCATVQGSLTCLTGDAAFGVQGIMVDATAPFGVRSTAAGTIAVTLGHEEFALAGDQAAIFDFRDGFTFRFYGKTYTRAWVSSNGFISFEQANTGFPSPTVNEIRFAEPRIMSHYCDLEPQIQTHGPRVFARQFVDSTGTTKVKFVHERLSQFGDATGPHGGEIVLTENNEVSVWVAPYNTPPSIPHPTNVAVGISPGNGVDPGPLPTPFGRDLVQDALSGPTVVGAGRLAFELFDHGNLVPANPMNVIIAFGTFNGSNVGPGIVWSEDAALPQTSPADSGYVIR